MKPAAFEYHRARSLGDALEHLDRCGDEAKVLAGGQSLAPLLNMRLARPAVLVDINRLPGLDRIAVVDGSLEIGALVRHRAVERDPAVAEHVPLLAEATPWIGHPAIRNRGTLGGSLCHADSAAELPAVAVALRATIVVQGTGGTRTVPAAEFFTGAFTTTLAPNELLVGTRWPRRSTSTGSAWDEFALRAGDYALVGVAALVRIDESGHCGSATLVCSGVGNRPVALTQSTAALIGRPLSASVVADAAEAAAREVEPSSDLMASARYKRRLLGVLVARALTTAGRRARQE